MTMPRPGPTDIEVRSPANPPFEQKIYVVSGQDGETAP